MERLNIIPPFTLLMLLTCFGCSNFEKKSASDNHAEKGAESIVGQTKKQVESGLEKITTEAMSQGEGAVRFLSGDLFLKASNASIRGDSHSAALIFKFLVKMNPEDIYLSQRYSVELIRTGKLKEARSILRKLHEKNNKNETVSLVLAGVETALGQGRAAESIYRGILSYSPGNEESCIFLSKSYALKKKYKNAYRILRKCEKVSKKAIFSYYKGKIAVTQKKFHVAAKYFQESLKRDETFYQAANALGIYYEENGEEDKAVDLYESFLKISPQSYSILARLVNLLFERGAVKEVIPYAERLSALDESDLNLKVRLGILYTDVRMYEQAKSIFKEVLKRAPDSDRILYYLGSLYQQTDDYEKSLEYFNKIPVKSSLYMDSSLQVAQMLNLMASAGYNKGNHSAAKRLKRFVVSRSGQSSALKVELKVILAGFHENQKEIKQAIFEIESVREEEEFNEGHDYYLAALYEKNNQFPKARAVIEKILKKNPDNPHALNFLGYSLLERGMDLDQAFNYISKAVKLRPNDGYIRDSLGWYYYKTGDIKKAYLEIKKARELIKSDSVISKHLGIIYKEMKKYEEAKFYYVEALNSCKLDSEKAEVIKELEILENLRLPASSTR